MLERVLGEFGKQLGFQNLSLNEQGMVSVQIEDTDRLEMQRLEHELLVCYVVPHERIDQLAFLQELLLLPHPDNLNPFPLQVGTVQNKYVMLIVRLQLERLGSEDVVAAFEFLWELKQSLFY